MSTETEPQQGHTALDLLFSTTIGIAYGIGIALLILLLFVFTLDPEILSSLNTIFFGSSI